MARALSVARTCCLHSGLKTPEHGFLWKIFIPLFWSLCWECRCPGALRRPLQEKPFLSSPLGRAYLDNPWFQSKNAIQSTQYNNCWRTSYETLWTFHAIPLFWMHIIWTKTKSDPYRPESISSSKSYFSSIFIFGSCGSYLVSSLIYANHFDHLQIVLNHFRFPRSLLHHFCCLAQPNLHHHVVLARCHQLSCQCSSRPHSWSASLEHSNLGSRLCSDFVYAFYSDLSLHYLRYLH